MAIAKLLSNAVRLWLKSQVSQTDNLNIKIKSQNREIIQGSIPEVFISATNTIYQGLHCSELEVVGNNIKVNLAQIIKRKPLQLLEPIAIDLRLLLQEIDLQNSLSSPLLSTGLTDLWHRFLVSNYEQLELNESKYEWDRLSLLGSGISFAGKYDRPNLPSTSIGITTNIQLNDAHSLLLSPLEIVTIPELVLNYRDRFILDLGTQVSITYFNLTPQYLLLKGKITVFPELTK